MVSDRGSAQAAAPARRGKAVNLDESVPDGGEPIASTEVNGLGRQG